MIWGDYKPSGQPAAQVDRLTGGNSRDFIYASHGTNYIRAGAATTASTPTSAAARRLRRGPRRPVRVPARAEGLPDPPLRDDLAQDAGGTSRRFGRMGRWPRRRPSEQRAWLEGEPPLAEVRAAFPREWAEVQRELAAVVDRDDAGAVQAYAARSPAAGGTRRARRGRGAGRQRMAAAALRQMGVAAATGVTSGTLRFGLVSGRLTQRLLFGGGGLERKPVSMRRSGLVWPLVRQKSLPDALGPAARDLLLLLHGPGRAAGRADRRPPVRGDRRRRRHAGALPARRGRRRRRDRRRLLAPDAPRAGAPGDVVDQDARAALRERAARGRPVLVAARRATRSRSGCSRPRA